MNTRKQTQSYSLIEENKVSFFPTMSSTNVSYISLEQLLSGLKNDSAIEITTKCAREALQGGDKKTFDLMKSRSGAITPAVVCSGGHAYKNILSFTGVSMVDMDHVPSERMTKVLELCRADEHTLMVWTTASGSGVRVLFRYRAVDVVTGEQRCSITRAEYEQAWHAGNSYYAALCHTETDPHTKDATRMSFLCHDPEALLRVDAVPLLVPLGESPSASSAAGLGAHGGARSGRGSAEAAAPDGDALFEWARGVVEREGIGYAHGSRNSYVMRMAYLLNRLGMSAAEAQRRLEALGDYDEVEPVVRSCYSHTDQHATLRLGSAQRMSSGRTASGTAQSKGSRADASRSGRGASPSEPRLTPLKVKEWLSGVALLRYNEVTCKTEIRPLHGSLEGLLQGTMEGTIEGSGSTATAQAASTTAHTSYGAVPSLSASSMEPSTASANASSSSSSASSSASSASSSALSSNAAPPSAYVELTDRMVNSLYNRLISETRALYPIDRFLAVIHSDYVPTYNPLRAYLESVQGSPYEGDPIGALAARVHLADEAQRELFAHCFRKWFVAMVASMQDERVVNHTVLMLIGPQGIYKSTFVSRLLPPVLQEYYMTMSSPSRFSKDETLALSEYALICLDEFESVSGTQLQNLKSVITMQATNERAVYARYRQRRPRRASFCATGNYTSVLTDPTGNRRWLPFEIEAIDSPFEHPIDYTAVYAQALDLIASGFHYWFTTQDSLQLRPHLQHFEVVETEEELVSKYLRKPAEGERGEFMTATDVLELIGPKVMARLNSMAIGRAMTKLGFKKVKRGNYGYIAVRLSPEELTLYSTGETTLF